MVRTGFIQWLLQLGEEPNMNWIQTPTQKAGDEAGDATRKALKGFEGGWSMGLGHLDLFIGAHPEEKHTPIFTTGGSGHKVKQGTHCREALIFP